MSKKLAIKGHPTRGKEVIKLLEMMGGNNSLLDTGLQLSGTEYCCVYYIGTKGSIIYSHYSMVNDDFIVFTLEEFLEKYPFKVGDKVIDEADGCPGVVCEMKWDEDVSDMKYCVVFGNGIDFGWFANDSIEFYKEDKNLDETKVESTGFMQVCKTAGIIFNDANYADEVELNLGDYEIEVRDGKTFAVKKKPKYPDNYEECVRIAKNIHGYDIHIDAPAYGELMESFVKLLICRDAYWKIAGEEMDLDKPWEPDWSNFNDGSYPTITKCNNRIIKTSIYTHDCILAFPIEELRDIFYENFKDLMEQCKELL